MFRIPQTPAAACGRRVRPYLVAGVVTAGALALALASPANGAPSGVGAGDRTVENLQTQGYDVIVNKTGAAPLDECTVSAVRPGVTHQTTDVRGSDIKPLIISDTVHVDVTC